VRQKQHMAMLLEGEYTMLEVSRSKRIPHFSSRQKTRKTFASQSFQLGFTSGYWYNIIHISEQPTKHHNMSHEFLSLS
jgi:hypothetical protein